VHLVRLSQVRQSLLLSKLTALRGFSKTGQSSHCTKRDIYLSGGDWQFWQWRTPIPPVRYWRQAWRSGRQLATCSCQSGLTSHKRKPWSL